MEPTDHNQSFPITSPRKDEPKRKMTRKERRAFQRKLKNPKYKKRIQRIISESSKKKKAQEAEKLKQVEVPTDNTKPVTIEV